MKEKEGKKKAKKNKVSKKAKKLEKRQKRKIKNKKKKNAKKSRRVKSQNSNKIVSQTCTAVRRWKCQCTRLFWKQYLASNFKITSYCCQLNQLPRQYQASLWDSSTYCKCYSSGYMCYRCKIFLRRCGYLYKKNCWHLHMLERPKPGDSQHQV